MASLLPSVSTLKTTARSRADDHERLQTDIDATAEHIRGQRALYENFALLAKRDDKDRQKDKGRRWKGF